MQCVQKEEKVMEQHHSTSNKHLLLSLHKAQVTTWDI